ncbi:MAG: hypothetical protein IPH73_14605 [Rhodocyclales bacterium]|nr:hypothetical protein [Rhodocyclales bacterium]
MPNKLKTIAGVLGKDLPIYASAVLNRKGDWLAIRNRSEHLEAAPDGSGYRCDWQWTSDLHAPRVLPFLGRWLMRRALADHPIRRLSQPEQHPTQPEVSFIIGHRGMARLPHLLATLESIAGQQGVSIECIVIEQETGSLLAGRLPSWVRHIHTPPSVSDMPYCRSWAFNIGVKQARGSVLVLHDNDMLVPADYTAQILKLVNLGYEVVNLKRFIFYLNEKHTQGVFARHASLMDEAPEAIVQNLEAGGSIAITSDVFDRIGGMDESFIGWGGEDNEFWERAQTCKVWPYGYLPIVHLWHASQPGKCQSDSNTLKHYRALSNISAHDRIAKLRQCTAGEMAGPNGYGLSVGL